jgi:heme exporter protein C
MVRNWWKIVCGILLFYVIIAGLVLEVPARFVLNETIRNLYFHVPMWFTMVALFSVSFYGSLRFLRSGDLKYDRIAAESAFVGILFGILGLLTGSLWAKYTWGAFWTNDVKLNGSAITLLVFLAYAVLRGNTQEEQKRARLAAVYNIFAFVMMVVLIFLLPTPRQWRKSCL